MAIKIGSKNISPTNAVFYGNRPIEKVISWHRDPKVTYNQVPYKLMDVATGQPLQMPPYSASVIFSEYNSVNIETRTITFSKVEVFWDIALQYVSGYDAPIDVIVGSKTLQCYNTGVPNESLGRMFFQQTFLNVNTTFSTTDWNKFVIVSNLESFIYHKASEIINEKILHINDMYYMADSTAVTLGRTFGIKSINESTKTAVLRLIIDGYWYEYNANLSEIVYIKNTKSGFKTVSYTVGLISNTPDGDGRYWYYHMVDNISVTFDQETWDKLYYVDA